MLPEVDPGAQVERSNQLEPIRCGCCEAVVPRRESKVCKSCGRTICPACTQWYGHFMMVCDDCCLARW
jgi:hypothetical protein